MTDKSYSGGNLTKRITQELASLQTKKVPVTLVDGDITHWKAIIVGPNESPYKGGKFLVDIKFVDYPMRHPEIKFDTLVYHPNIDQQGKICIGILKEWKPTNKMEGVLSALTSFLNEPDPEDPLDAEIARIYKEEPDTFKSTAATWTKRHGHATLPE